ncbi:sodium/potassium/calcium exchanger 1 isoform X1 [Tachysurus fulvidraco]|uniref:sodium/potassium/calcium exchanger 1 isoform X1 n=1 Tax=Tachysurus fulvidraco TaxID=1234273 RepID=UPI001FEDF45E|nr:sodium/potassium/calcium exchanger 1 isoform X1 [Tachysurus fulvidraco]
MYLTRRKRLQLTRIIFLLSGVLLCCIYQLTVRTRLPGPWPEPQIGENPKGGPEDATEGLVVKPGVTAKLTTGAVEEGTSTHTAPKPDTTPSTTPLRTERAKTTVLRPMTTTNRTIVRCIYVDPDLPKPNPVPTPAPEPTHPTPTIAISVTAEPPHIKGEYPQDIFTIEERRRGWVILHIFGMIYMFVSLAIVCDEFFVPTLGVITKKLEISDDVAGATFMAAGGSAPELFTSLIGVFISHSNVGIGTIVGSAVFNILFVIGMCALFSREMLYLTWWPLFRDVSFYILDLIMLIIFFLDNTIMWWESIMLVGGYAIYVYFMKYNVQIERAFKSQLRRHKNIVKVIPVEEPEKENGTTVDDNSTPEPEDKNRLKLKPTLQRGGSSASLHNSTMRNTIFQLMIHTLDPLGEDSVVNGGTMPSSSLSSKVKFKEKAQILNSMARGKVEGKEKEKSGKGEDCNTEDTKESKEPGPAPSNKADTKEKPEGQKEEKEAAAAGEGGGSEGSEGSDDSDDDSEEDSDEDSDDEDDDQEEDDEDGEENEEPLSLEWPDTRRKQATYLFLLPIVFPLWLTVPDVRNPASRKYFVITFLGSIVWIAIFSYLMVWWAHQVGETIGISEEIMGLTILAAGTSIPDLITSVIVARKGLGDMAVSSSVGSNIFDITVGLPVPWLLFSSFHGMVPVAVSSNGLFCAIVLLFLMLLFVIISIAVCKWRMNKMLGFTMFLLYFVFLVLSVMLEDRIIVCPVSI